MKQLYVKSESELGELLGHNRQYIERRRKRADEWGIPWPSPTKQGHNVEKVRAAVEMVNEEMDRRGTLPDPLDGSARERLTAAQEEYVRLKIARLKGAVIPREEHLAKLGAVAGMVNRFFDAMKQAVETETKDPATCALVERICREKAAELAAKVKPV